jgi:hypothetical protein
MFSIYNVYCAREERGKSFLVTLPQLLPMVLFFAANFAWLLSPFSHVLENNGLMRVALTMTFVFGRMTTKIILVAAREIRLIQGTSHETTLPLLHHSHRPLTFVLRPGESTVSHGIVSAPSAT